MLVLDELIFMYVKRFVLFVVNIDISENVGLYWVCIYFFKFLEDGIEFFDLLVYFLNVYNNFILMLLIVNGVNFIYLKKWI